MKKQLILLLFVCFTLIGCNQKENDLKGEFDIKGIITEVQSDGCCILVDAEGTGLIWVTLPDNGEFNNFEEGQVVTIWIDGGILESYPAQAKALNIEYLYEGDTKN